MMLLPSNIVNVLRCAAKENARWAQAGAKITHLTPTRFELYRPETEEGYPIDGPMLVREVENRYRVEATDHRQAIRVEGICQEDDHDERRKIDNPIGKALAERPNTGTQAIIGRDDFAAAFDGAKSKRGKPRLPMIGLQIGKDETTLATSDPDGRAISTTTAAHLDGRFPPTEDLYAKMDRERCAIRVCVNPQLMAQLLTTLASFTEEEAGGVEIILHPHHSGPNIGKVDQPIYFRAINPELGQETKAILMPLTFG